mgnify:CR=1 FL=1
MHANNTVTLTKFYRLLWLRPILLLLLFIFLYPVVYAQSNSKSKVKPNWNEILEEQLCFHAKSSKIQRSIFRANLKNNLSQQQIMLDSTESCLRKTGNNDFSKNKDYLHAIADLLR